jgi:peptide-methionine (S)-S-oxide reductase
MLLASAVLAMAAVTTPADLGPVPAKQVRVFLIRHGQAYSNLDPQPDLPPTQLDRLTDLGHSQSRRAGRALKGHSVALVLSSPAGRARERAEELAAALGAGVPRVDPRLRPLELGRAAAGEPLDWDARAVWRAVRVTHDEARRSRAVDAKDADGIQTAVLAGGCFWGVQGVFQHTAGVVNAVSGYSGGTKASADYNMVSAGTTGHAEAVEVKYDPKKISYGKILQIFFSVVHDPTQLNRQGPDTGTQYRSAIFYKDEAQKDVAQAYIKQIEQAKAFDRPIVTRVDAYKGFYPAEAYHQDYLVEHPRSPYIAYNDLPKVEHLKQLFPVLWRDQPVTVAMAKNRE